MEKPFEVGEVVWSWPDRAWGEIKAVRDDGQIRWGGDSIYSGPHLYSRDPIIPPKPKKMVTKEAKMCRCPSCYTSHCDTIAAGDLVRGFHMPIGSRNIRCLYDIEE